MGTMVITNYNCTQLHHTTELFKYMLNTVVDGGVAYKELTPLLSYLTISQQPSVA